jgi:hypothetical protein
MFSQINASQTRTFSAIVRTSKTLLFASKLGPYFDFLKLNLVILSLPILRNWLMKVCLFKSEIISIKSKDKSEFKCSAKRVLNCLNLSYNGIWLNFREMLKWISVCFAAESFVSFLSLSTILWMTSEDKKNKKNRDFRSHSYKINNVLVKTKLALSPLIMSYFNSLVKDCCALSLIYIPQEI